MKKQRIDYTFKEGGKDIKDIFDILKKEFTKYNVIKEWGGGFIYKTQKNQKRM